MNTPIIGAGCYANNATVAVSSTGNRVQVRVTVPARGPTAWIVPSGRFVADATALREENDDGNR